YKWFTLCRKGRWITYKGGSLCSGNLYPKSVKPTICVVHFGLEYLVHFTPESVVQFSPDYTEIVEEFKNVVRFQPSAIKVNLLFNDYDKSVFAEIGKKEKTLYPLNDNVIKELFNSSLSVDQVTPETFVKNISILFETKEGSEMLKGNVEPYVKYKLSEIDEYSTTLMQKQ